MRMKVFVVASMAMLAGTLTSVLAQDYLTSGSGFLVDPQGYILTAEHVVADAGSEKVVAIEVIVGGQQQYLAEVVKTDKINDLALLKIEGKDLPSIKLGRAEAAKRQEAVWVIGFPLGYADISTASGKITAFRANTKLIGDDRKIEQLIETDARVNAGNSGGPLVNNRAQAIGVVHAKIQGTLVERTGFAVPMNLAIPLLEEIPGFDESKLGRETQEFSGMEVDANVTPAVVQIKIKMRPKEDLFKESIQRAKQLQQNALKELQANGIHLPDNMVLIPAGKFIMGSNDDEDDEKPEHTVYLDAYFIDKYEVTTSQYEKFFKATGRETPTYWTDAVPVIQGDRPVFGVTWHDAKAYCEYFGKRLPTEAEWEKAARGADGWNYPWGERYKFPYKGNFGQMGDSNPYATVLKPIGSYEDGKSPYGAYDMAGNVLEWVADWYDGNYYQSSPKKNPTGSSNGSFKVLRGGSWVDSGWEVRSTKRFFISPDFKNLRNGGGNGFRCAKNP